MSSPDSMSSARTGRRSELLEHTLYINQTQIMAKSRLTWTAVNGLVLSIILYHLSLLPVRKHKQSLLYWVEITTAVIFLINTVFNFTVYLTKSFSIRQVPLSPIQRKLLGVPDSDPNFKNAVTPKNLSFNESLNRQNRGPEVTSLTPMNLSANSWLSQSVLNESASPNYSVASPTWVYHPCNTSMQLESRSSMISSDEFITDEDSLNQYLQSVEEYEKKEAAVTSSGEQPSNIMSSFWNHQGSKGASEVSPLLRRCAYQVAPLTPNIPVTTSPGNNSDESGSPLALQLQQDLWRRLKVDHTVMTQWNANLRLWISKTILSRLVKEFGLVDESLQRYSLSDMRIGQVGLERLKKTAQIQQIATAIPSLVRLVPFLDLTPHQEYLVSRIKDLAKGGSMSDYRWNSGGTLNGKNWEEHLPTDAALVMHVVATYLDSQLVPLPHHPDGRPFSTQYHVKTPEKPTTGRNGLIVYQSQLNPPHFILIDNEESIDVGKGRNNLLHTLLLFVHLLKTKEHGMLGRVNLGPSGVNILWVLES